MTRILVVDDVPAMAEQYAYDLKRIAGWRTRIADGGREALEVLAGEPVDAMLLDLEMPGIDGFEVLEEMARRGFDVPVVVYTGTGDFDRCARAIRLGARGFIDKVDPMERVVHELRAALREGRLVSEVVELRARVADDGPLVGSGPAMRRLREEIDRAAPIPSPVLVLGESGSGKELVARELHRLGTRPGGPFVALNGAALPESLVESELFGHERGAFTGADRLRRGAFERAAEGTLFLDEVGELPAAAQAKLLRVLETGELTRVGGERTVEAAPRVVAATHRNLEVDVEAGRFRSDLLFRLNVHVIRVPPLRERREDIPELAARLLEGICARLGIRPRRLAPEMAELLAGSDWRRNNVRELRNVLERMAIAADAPVIGPECVPPDLRGADGVDGAGDVDGPAPGRARDFRSLRAEAERRIVRDALRRNDGHVTRTAAELGLADHASLLRLMRRLGIERD